MAAALDIAHLRTWIGRVEEAEDEVTPELAHRFRATLDLPGDCGRGAEAPTLIHLCLAPPAVPASELGPDGHPARGGFLPPVPLPRRMWAGGAFRPRAPLRIGDRVTRRSTIGDVAAKHGRTGPLCFVAVRHEILVGGELRIAETQDIVYRGTDAGAAPAPTPTSAPPAPEGEHRRTVTPTPTLLFRYSALTFNGHRIHYDRPYALSVEGYPGLVVHGPMQATMLFHHAARIQGAEPSEFRFRSLSPLFDGTDFTLHAAPAADGMDLWTAGAGGPVAMRAEARWNG